MALSCNILKHVAKSPMICMSCLSSLGSQLVIFVSTGTSRNVGSYFFTTREKETILLAWWVESLDAAKHPQSTGHPSHQCYLDIMSISAEAEKLVLKRTNTVIPMFPELRHMLSIVPFLVF